MSETEAVEVEPVPVTKDPTLVNGENGPHPPEIQNGQLGKQTIDMSNGVGHDMNDVVEPVNGNMNGQDDETDLMEDDDLPPPPEVVSDLPPPPPSGVQEDVIIDEQVDEIGVEKVNNEVEELESAAPAVSSEVDNLVDLSEDIGGAVGVDNVELKPAMDISDEELVSDSGLKDEVDPEGQENKENEAVEQQAEAPLVDLGVSESVQEQVDEAEIPVVPEPTEPLVPVSYQMVNIETENIPEAGSLEQPVEDVGSSIEPEIIEEPVQESESVIEAKNEPEIEPMPEPEPQSVPVSEPTDKILEPEKVVEQSEPANEVQQIPEVNITQEEEEEPAVEQSQVGYAEPDIIVDNKPMEDELQGEEEPPPPPPPLEEETPPPPPPLDENVPLKRDRRSGGSTPNKQSPSKEIVTPTAPVVVETVKEQEMIQQEPEVIPVAEPVATPQKAVEKPPETVPTPVIPPVEDLSPPGSPSTVSEPALSEVGQGEPAEPHPSVSAQVSQKINKKNFKNKIKFGVDLVEAALKQLSFLNNVNRESGLYEEWLFKRAIRRYEAFWLPMAAEHKKECLAAPLDIEWVWHCHMLAPLAYETDSKNLVGLIVEHKLMSEKDRTKALEKSKKYWVTKYPNEPFEIDLVYKEKEPEVEVPAEPVQPGEGDTATETQAESGQEEQTGNKFRWH